VLTELLVKLADPLLTPYETLRLAERLDLSC
jgi:hypothetical protein